MKGVLKIFSFQILLSKIIFTKYFKCYKFPKHYLLLDYLLHKHII